SFFSVTERAGRSRLRDVGDEVKGLEIGSHETGRTHEKHVAGMVVDLDRVLAVAIFAHAKARGAVEDEDRGQVDIASSIAMGRDADGPGAVLLDHHVGELHLFRQVARVFSKLPVQPSLETFPDLVVATLFRKIRARAERLAYLVRAILRGLLRELIA